MIIKVYGTIKAGFETKTTTAGTKYPVLKLRTPKLGDKVVTIIDDTGSLCDLSERHFIFTAE